MLGAPLVERGVRHIYLTPLGEAFARRANDILRSVDELEDLARAAQGAFAGRLRIGVIPTVAPYLLPDMIKIVMGRFPALDLRLREATTEIVIEDLMESRLDMAIVALPMSEPSLREFALFEEEFVLVRPEVDAEKPVPSPKQLLEMRLLLLEEGHCFRDQALSFCEASGSEPQNLMEGSSLSTLVQMVGAGLGVTLIPEMALPLETRSAAISVSRFPDPRPTRSIGMVWRKTNPLQDQLIQIGGVVRASGKKLGSGPDGDAAETA